MVIYKAINKINDKSYIGQTIRGIEIRKSEHLNDTFNKKSQSYFHKAIRKYGKENFEWEILCECKDIDELNKMEKHYIKEYNTFIDSGGGYNMTTGGDGHTISEETIENMRNARLGKFCGENNSFYGKRHTEETKQKISKIRIEGKIAKGNNNPMYNINHTEETKQKIRKSKLGVNIKHKIVKCPHCVISGGSNVMYRWHFDNCREI